MFAEKLKWLPLLYLLLTGCSTSSGNSSPVACAQGTKLCAGVCVPSTNPDTGCAASLCTPCSLSRASATCSETGACAIGLCASSWGDCNGEPQDGCETDLSSTSANCGVCGMACKGTEICLQATCKDKVVADTAAWLATKNDGYCMSQYNQMINLCGDVEFCFDQRYMRTYTSGIAVDVVFRWDGVSKGLIFDFGGDCNNMRVSLGTKTAQEQVLEGAGFGITMDARLTAGKHLASVQINASGEALWIDGVLVSEGAPPTATKRLHDACGPGLILGQRISYWWEAPQASTWMKYAVGFVHLRENIDDVKVYDLSKVTSAHSSTVFLFDETGVGTGTWAARVGGLTAVAKNAVSGDPEIGVAASGPVPVWRGLSECF